MLTLRTSAVVLAALVAAGALAAVFELCLVCLAQRFHNQKRTKIATATEAADKATQTKHNNGSKRCR